VRDEQLPGGSHLRNGSPAIALDASGGDHVLLTTADDTFRGFYASRSDAAWTSEQLPGSVAQGALALDAEGAPVALVDDGAAGTTLWRRDAVAWSKLDDVAGVSSAFAGEMVRTGMDCLLAGVTEHGGERPTLAVRSSGTWGLSALGTAGSDWTGPFQIAVGDSGRPQAAFFETSGVKWQMPPLAAETALAQGSNPLLAVAGETAHMLASHPAADVDGAYELVYVTRTADGWANQRVALGDADGAGFELCGPPPAMAGQTCMYEYRTYRPVAAAVSGGGDVELFYAEYDVTIRAISSCASSCEWNDNGSSTRGDLYVASPKADGLSTASVLTDVVPGGTTAALDAAGHIHLAIYDGGGGFHDSIVRYVELAGP
jgi:hypothetical protein